MYRIIARARRVSHRFRQLRPDLIAFFVSQPSVRFGSDCSVLKRLILETSFFATFGCTCFRLTE
jgi:hypothetical protein